MRGYEFIEVTSDHEKLACAKAFIIEGLAAGHFRPQIARTLPFESIVDATRFLESNAQFGRVVATTV